MKLKTLIFFSILLLPALIIYLAGILNFHIFISVLYTLTGLLILIEAFLGIKTVKDYGNKNSNLTVTALIVAYLPNEKDIILDTLNYFSNLKEFDNVILAYNTPHNLEVENFLDFFDVKIVKVLHSKSKAQNINYVLDSDLISTDLVAIYDTDHRPVKGFLKKVKYWFNKGYIAVQGRSVIYNQNQNLLTRIIATEFHSFYRLLHNTRFNLIDCSIFGGSNCFWDYKFLQQMRLKEVLTEDIDLTLRTIMQGKKLAYDPNIVSLEEAPTTLQALWKQRVRWAMGWCECTLAYTYQILKCKNLDFKTKLYWFYNLPYREVFTLLSFSVFYIISMHLIFDTNVDSFWWNFFWGTTFFNISLILIQGFILTKTSKIPELKTKASWQVYLFWFIPYAIFKSLASVMAITRLLIKDFAWQCTARDNVNKK